MKRIVLCAFFFILLQINQVTAHQAYDYQAVILQNKSLDFKWYPQQEEKIVIVIDKNLCQENIKSWHEFYNSSAVLGINTDSDDFAHALFAFTQGMGKEPYCAETLLLLRQLSDSDRLLVIDNAMEYSHREIYPASCQFPVEFMFESRAVAAKAAGRNLCICAPREGTLSLTKGEISKAGLTKYTASIPFTRVANPDILNTYVSNIQKTIRRDIIHIRQYSAADGYEHLASYFILLILIVFAFGYLMPQVTRPSFKNTLSCLEFSLLLFTMVRIIKLEVPSANITLLRYLWYAYYPCFFALSLICLLIAYYTGTPIEEKKIPLWWKAVCFLDLVCVVIIFTNDFHGLFAAFGPNVVYNDYIYKPGFLNTPIKALLGLEFIAVPALLVKNNVRSKFTSYKILWPLAIMIGELCYHFCYSRHILGANNTETVLITNTGVLLFLFASAYAGIFPTNRGYSTAFTYSTASMVIHDKEDKVVYDSATKQPSDHNLRLHIKPLAGGKLIWQEDISAINSLKRDLALNNAALSRYNKLLQEKKQVRSHLVELDLQEKLFKELTTIIALKKEKMQALAASLQDKGLPSVRREYYINLLSCLIIYVKKRSVLLLSSHEHNRLLTPEFSTALAESCSFYLKAGLNTACTCNLLSASLNASDALAIYDLAELVWEGCARTPGADLLISISDEHGPLKIVIKAQADLQEVLADVTKYLKDKPFYDKHEFSLTVNDNIATLTMLRKEEVINR